MTREERSRTGATGGKTGDVLDRGNARPGRTATLTGLGFRMPAEWEPHESTWLAWPHDPLTWLNGVDRAEDAFVEMVRALVDSERVDLMVKDEAMRDRLADRFAEEGIPAEPRDEDVLAPRPSTSAGRRPNNGGPERMHSGVVRMHVVPYADSWVRDYGPTFVVNRARGELVGVDWRFNAWGDKYDALKADDRLGRYIAEAAGARRVRLDAVMEGGAIDVNGKGTVVTTEQCLLNRNRNPSLDRAAIEALLHRHLGTREVVWLGQGIEGDDTDGHVDDVARFVSEDTLVAAVQPDEADPDHAALSGNLRRLQAFERSNGGRFQVVELPMPAEPVADDGGRYPASYANFYIANRTVLLPVFDDPNDARAKAVLEKVLPGRKVVPIDARDLVCGMGACHCLTQQQPRV